MIVSISEPVQVPAKHTTTKPEAAKSRLRVSTRSLLTWPYRNCCLGRSFFALVKDLDCAANGTTRGFISVG